MKKSMYSIVLSDRVVEELDKLAAERGTTRSGLADRILAEYCRVQSHDIQTERIFDRLKTLFEDNGFSPSRAENSGVMSIRRCLSCKYRPTVRYDIKLKQGSEKFGTLRVWIRAQNSEISRDLADFYSLLISCESGERPMQRECSFRDGKFLRPLYYPNCGASADELAVALCEYVRMLDDMLNAYLAGVYENGEEFGNDYIERASYLPYII